MTGVTVPDDLRVTLIGKSSKDAYPIVTMTWLLAYTTQKDAGKGVALARFLWWATHDGQQYNASQVTQAHRQPAMNWARHLRAIG